MADKRIKNRDNDALRALREQLYRSAPRGEQSLSDTIKTMRKISGLTQAEFARHRGVSLPSLRQIERGCGNPTVETLNKLAAVYGLRVGLVPNIPPTASVQPSATRVAASTLVEKKP